MKRLLVVLRSSCSSRPAAPAGGGRAVPPLFDGKLALPGLAPRSRSSSMTRRAARLCARPRGRVVRGRRPARPRPAVADGALSPRASGRLSEVLGDTDLAVDKRFLTLGLRAAARPSGSAPRPRCGPRSSATPRASTRRSPAAMDGRTAARVSDSRLHAGAVEAGGFAGGRPAAGVAAGREPPGRAGARGPGREVWRSEAARAGRPLSGQRAGDSRRPRRPPAGRHGHRDAPARRQRDRGRELAPRRRHRTMPAGLEWLSPWARRGNSNNWVVAGRRTTSGRPMLANDPHLQIEFPSVWYEMHLVAAGARRRRRLGPGHAVRGPRPQRAHRVGHDQHRRRRAGSRVERIDVGASGRFYRGEWVPVEIVKADIPVRGRSRPQPFEVWRTRHGTVFAEVGLRLGRAAGVAVARRSAGGGAARVFAALGCRAARSRRRSRRSIAPATGRVHRPRSNAFSVPSQNVVYADVDGNIGYAMSGRLPMRASGDGTLPVDGSAGDGVDRLDRAVDAAARVQSRRGLHHVVEQPDRSRLPRLITRDWAAPFRATRLRDVVARRKASISMPWRRCRTIAAAPRPTSCWPGLDAAISGPQPRERGGAGPIALEQLAKWDASSTPADRHALPGVRRRAVAAHVHRRDGRGAVLPVLRVGGRGEAGRLYAISTIRSRSGWTTSPPSRQRETRDDIFLLAAQRRRASSCKTSGAASRAADWDRVHAARSSIRSARACSRCGGCSIAARCPSRATARP